MADHGMTAQLGVASDEESPTAVPAGALARTAPGREHAEQQAAADDGDLHPVTLVAGKDATGAERTDDDGSHEHPGWKPRRSGPDRQGRTSGTTGVAVALSADSGNCPWPMLAAPGGPRRRLPGGVGRQHGRGRWRAGGGAGPPGRRRPTRWQRRPRRPPAGAGGRGGGAAGPGAGRGGDCGRRLRRGRAWQAARDAGAAARHGLPPAGRYARRPPPAARPTRRRRPTHPPPPRRPIRESAMAGRTPPGLRGWWRYSRLVGWRVTVLLTSSPP